MKRIVPESQKMIKHIPEYDGAGIYAIINIYSGKMYVGSSLNIHQRIYNHDCRMRNGYPASRFKDDIKNGARFTSIILERMDTPTRQELFTMEEYYVKHFDTQMNGYNRISIPNCDLDDCRNANNKAKIEYLTTPLKSKTSRI